MNEKEILLSHAVDAKNRCADNSMITNTNFISADERTALLPAEKELRDCVKTFYYGGYDDAERAVAVFVPSFFGIESIGSYFKENPSENPLVIIKIVKDRFSVLSHRDYLGALMGLGIKREMIGDIQIGENGCFVFVLKSISSYICRNLEKVGRGSVVCETMEVADLPEADEKAEIVFASVASLRLDNFVSAAFNLSRQASSDFIKSGTVYVNSVQSFKNDMILKQGDKVVLRGKGKTILHEVIGESKKGRLHINIKKFK